MTSEDPPPLHVLFPACRSEIRLLGPFRQLARREERDPDAAPAFTLVTVEVPREGPPRVTECSAPGGG